MPRGLVRTLIRPMLRGATEPAGLGGAFLGRRCFGPRPRLLPKAFGATIGRGRSRSKGPSSRVAKMPMYPLETWKGRRRELPRWWCIRSLRKTFRRQRTLENHEVSLPPVTARSSEVTIPSIRNDPSPRGLRRVALPRGVRRILAEFILDLLVHPNPLL